MIGLWLLLFVGDLRGEEPPEVSGRPASGSGALSPSQVPVGRASTFTYTYTVGETGLAAGDVIRLQDPVFHGMRWALWGYLSDDPADCSDRGALVTVDHTGDASVSLSSYRVDGEGTIHDYAYTEVTVDAGELVTGDQIRFTMGDTTDDADCALAASTRAMDRIPWIALEQRGGGGWAEVSPHPSFSFVTSSRVTQLLVSAPSQALVDEPFEVRVAALDPYGNPVRDATLPLLATLDGRSVDGHVLGPGDEGIWTFDLTVGSEGFARVEVSSSLGALPSARSNPIRVSADPPPLSIYWGDIHTHHGHSYVDELGSYHDQNHEYARDVAGLDVGCETVKASPHELYSDALWAQLQRSCAEYTADGEYVALLGFEWMGNQNSPGEEGHHNVYYSDCSGVLAPDTTTGLTGSDNALWAFMAEVEATTGTRAISVPHAPLYTGFNWTDRDDTYRPLAEVYSEWGPSDTDPVADRGIYNGLGAGNRMGLFAASDNHDGWMGNRWASFNAGGGLGAFVATDLSREGIFEAMQARSTYGSTGHRPYLSFSAEDGAAIAMGEEYIASAPIFHWIYAGEAEISEIELLAIELDDPGAATLEVLQSWTPAALDAEGSFTYTWDGVPRAVWLHAAEADGEQAWSSPIWLSDDCEDPQVVDPAGYCGASVDTAAPDTAG